MQKKESLVRFGALNCAPAAADSAQGKSLKPSITFRDLCVMCPNKKNNDYNNIILDTRISCLLESWCVNG